MTPSKFCRDCVHFPVAGSIISTLSLKSNGFICGRTFTEEKLEEPDPVMGSLGTGEFHWKTCAGCRADESDCGPDGKFFESSEERRRLWDEKRQQEEDERQRRDDFETWNSRPQKKSWWNKVFQ